MISVSRSSDFCQLDTSLNLSKTRGGTIDILGLSPWKAKQRQTGWRRKKEVNVALRKLQSWWNRGLSSLPENCVASKALQQRDTSPKQSIPCRCLEENLRRTRLNLRVSPPRMHEARIPWLKSKTRCLFFQMWLCYWSWRLNRYLSFPRTIRELTPSFLPSPPWWMRAYEGELTLASWRFLQAHTVKSGTKKRETEKEEK